VSIDFHGLKRKLGLFAEHTWRADVWEVCLNSFASAFPLPKSLLGAGAGRIVEG
jgi:hypothetical protein